MTEFIIKNHDEIIERLTEMLMKFDKDCNGYQTDVYLYYNEEEQTAELDTYVNVGGNSWLNDDHFTIYSDREHDSDMWDYYQSVEELAEYSEIPLDELRKLVIANLELDDDEAKDFKLDYYEAREYLKQNDEAMEKLTSAYNECIDEMQPEYVNRAEVIMQQFYLEKGFKENDI